MSSSHPARLLELDLARLERGGGGEVRPWASELAWLARVGRWSGGALGLALIYERASRRADEPAPLVISVGECVRRGVPTAARASIASRAPLTGLFAEGLVGSDLAKRIASFADAVALSGRTELPGAVLVLRAGGAAEIASFPELRGRSSRDVHAALVRELGACATLSIGVAGERRLPLASLAACGDVPHFVGRGGLGAVLGRLGLKAIAVTAPASAAKAELALSERLQRSPRLLARAEGGTLELYEAFDARGELRARADLAPVASATAAELTHASRAARAHKHGCAGCPTPCGWVFDTGAGAKQGARFGPSYALGLGLGLERFEDSLALLADCDELGLDAKEVAAVLALACELGEARWGELEELRALVRDIAGARGLGHAMGAGAASFARSRGRASVSAKGGSVRRDASLATLLGQCVSSRGGDPMRTFPFLAVDGADARAFRASTGLALPEGSADPLSPRGKGRLVAWHEDWANALDASGFCAFSAAALIADGVLGLDELADSIAPESLRAEARDSLGAALLEAGATLTCVQRRLNELWGLEPGADRPAWARAQLDAAGMWDEYALARGLDSRGQLTSERWSAVEAARSWRVDWPEAELAPRPQAVASARAPGTFTLRCSGPLRNVLGAEREVAHELPATLGEVLASLAAQEPRVSSWLVRDGVPVPAVFRERRRVDALDPVASGDVLDLVAVVAGG